MKLTKEEFNSISAAYPKMHSVLSQLSGVIHPEVEKELKEIQSLLNKGCKRIWDEQEDLADKEIEKLSQIADDNNFSSVWSYGEVSSNEMNEKMPFVIGTLVYQGWGPEVRQEVNAHLTWLEAWALADKAIKLSEDNHHIFIEDFEQNPKNDQEVILRTGS